MTRDDLARIIHDEMKLPQGTTYDFGGESNAKERARSAADTVANALGVRLEKERETMTRNDLAKIMYNESRIGFDVGWDHENVSEISRDYYRRAAGAAAKALGVQLEGVAPPPNPRYEAAKKALEENRHINGEWRSAIARAIVAALDADKKGG